MQKVAKIPKLRDKAVEKWLKITAFALKPANSPEQSFISKTLLARTVPALFAALNGTAS
jgi:hypothetical protein